MVIFSILDLLGRVIKTIDRILFHLFVNFGGDWSWLGLLRVEKVLKKGIFDFFWVFDLPDLSSEMIQKLQLPSYMTMCFIHLHAKFGIAVAEEDTCRASSNEKFCDFSLKKCFMWRNWITELFPPLNGEKFPPAAIRNRAKSGSHLMGSFEVTTSKRIFTILVYLEKWERSDWHLNSQNALSFKVWG